MRVHWAGDHALCVVLAAPGYPAAAAKGGVIDGLDGLEDSSRAMVFHAGTREREGRVVADGGRVLGVTATGETLREARDRAYAMLDAIDLPGGQARRDIGWRAL